MNSNRKNRSQLSLGWLTLPNATPLQLVRAASAAGFGALSMRVARRDEDNFAPIIGDRELISEITDSMAEHEIELLHMGGVWIDGVRTMDSYAPAFETANRLGTDMCVALATPDVPPGRVLQEMGELCALAKSHGIRVAIEFAAYSGIRTIEDAEALIAATRLDNLGILVDSLHFFRSGGKTSALAAIPARHIYLAQISDAWVTAPPPAQLQTEARGNRLDPGQGNLPLKEFIRALPAGAPLEVETPCLAYRNFDHVTRARLAFTAADDLLRHAATEERN